MNRLALISLGALALVAALAAILSAGRALVRTADELADRTGMGEAVAGALLLGAVTSLPGIATTIIGSVRQDAEFALANPIGGIAVQTVWLAIADLLGRSVQSLAPTRSQLIGKGMVWSPGHGDTAFTVPLFDGFMRRVMPGRDWAD